MNKLLFLIAVIPAICNAQIKVLVSGGQNIDINQVPHQVSLQKFGNHNCGGSIIGNKWILTAAHCVENTLLNSFTTIKTGISKLDTPISTTKEYYIKRTIIHPNYNKQTIENDIALIELTENIEFNSNVKIINLSDNNDLYNIGRNTKVSGWGLAYPGSSNSSNELNIVEVPIMSNNDAQKYYSNTITNNMIATHPISNNNRKGTCEGDSGGALITNDNNGVIKQIGIVSWGTRKCLGGLRSPSIYTKVANYINWIKQYVPLNNMTIKGNSVICDNTPQTYTIDNPNGDTIQWQLSDNIEKVSETTNSITIKSKQRFNGLATLKVSNGEEESTQNIWVGKPKVKINVDKMISEAVLEVVSSVDGLSLLEQGVQDKNISWINKTTKKSYIWNYYIVPLMTKMQHIEATISNDCGSIVTRVSVESKCNDIQYLFNKNNGNNYTLGIEKCKSKLQ